MLTTTVEVQRAQTIRAGAGQAWLLLASPAAAQLTAWLRECKAVLEGSRHGRTAGSQPGCGKPAPGAAFWKRRSASPLPR